MKHSAHLSLNTIVTIISLVVICVLLYTVTVKQDTKRDEDYKKLANMISEQQKNLEIEQRIRQSDERKLYNLERLVIPVPTLETLIIREVK